MSEMPTVLARFPSAHLPGIAWYVTMTADGVLFCGFPDNPGSGCKARQHGHESCVHVQTVADERARSARADEATKNATRKAWMDEPVSKAGGIGPGYRT